MRLFIRILSAPEPADSQANQTDDAMPFAWLVRDDDGQTVAQGSSRAGGLAEIVSGDAVPDLEGAIAEPDNVVVIVPGAEVAWLSRTIPGRRLAQMRRALPFAVEEFLTQDVESMHLAHGPVVRGQTMRCALIDRQLIAGWLASLTEHGLRPGHMVPDASLLPCDEVSASVLIEGREALVRTPEHMASLSASTLPDVLESVRASFGETDGPLDLQLFGSGGISEPQLADRGFNVAKTALRDTVLDFLASRWEADRPEINLLQGQFAPPRPRSASPSGWRGVATLAAVWLIVTLAVLIAEGYVANHRADALESESKDLYRSIYPNERRVPNAYAQMRAKLGESNVGRSAFHLLLGRLAAGTTERDGQVNVRSITFNGSRGELTSELWLDGYAQIDALKLELESHGLSVDITSAEERDSVVRARLRIRVPEWVSEEAPG